MKYQVTTVMKRPNLETSWGIPSGDQFSKPWSLLGFADKPSWWDSKYGANCDENCACWNDIEKGIIADGDRAGTHSDLAMAHIKSIVKINKALHELAESVTEEGFDTLEYRTTVIFKDFETAQEFSAGQMSDEEAMNLENFYKSKNISISDEISYI